MSFIKYTLSVVSLVYLLVGLYDLLRNGFRNQCEMTYMFQLPQYIPIPLTVDLETRFPTYQIYIYGEGGYAESLKSKHYRGIPVLFLPGNGGSYKQVRSLASVAYSKAIDEKHSFHFNFFTLNFNEELGGFSGMMLESQIEFTGCAIKTIMKLYANNKKPPKSIILVGHSMGGIVAQAVTLEKDINVSLIITQAAPLSRPVFHTDENMSNLYRKVNKSWTNQRKTSLKNVVLISLAGGRNDIQVPSMFTSTPFADLHETTMSVPNCWLTTDHLAIVWCRQLVLAIVRGLFNAVDKTTYRIYENRNRTLDAFKYQLSQRPGSKYNYPPKFPKTITDISTKGHWSESPRRQFYKDFDRSHSDHFVMIPIFKEPKTFNHLSVVVEEMDNRNWIFACKPDVIRNKSKICSEGINLSGEANIVPGDRKQIELNVRPLIKRNLTYVVIWVPPTNDKISVGIDVSDPITRHKKAKVPHLYEFFSPELLVSATPMSSVTYNVTLEGFYQAWQSYTLKLGSLHRCHDNHQLPIVKMKPSWMKRWDYIPARSPRSEFILELDTDMSNSNENSTVHIQIILNPSCTYNISIEANIIGIARRMLVLYGSQLPAYVTAQFLLALAWQIKTMASTGLCPPISPILRDLSPLTIVPLVKILSSLPQNYKLITDDFELMEQGGITLSILPIFLFIAGSGVAMAIAGAMMCATIFSSFLIMRYGTRAVQRFLSVHEYIAEYFISWAINPYYLETIVALAVIVVTPIAFSHFCLVVYFFIKLTFERKKLLEEDVRRLFNLESDSTIDKSIFNMDFTIMMLLLLECLISLPAFISWVTYQVEFPYRLTDGTWVPIVTCGFVLMCSVSSYHRKQLQQKPNVCYLSAALIYLDAILVVLYGSLHLNTIHMSIAGALLIYCLQYYYNLHPPTPMPPEVPVGEAAEVEASDEEVYDFNHNNDYIDEESSQNEDLLDTDITSDEDNDHVLDDDY